MVPQHVADILAEEALDTFAEFLHPVYIFLRDPPGAIFGIRGAWFEFLDLLFDLEVPADIGHQVLCCREGLDGFDGYRLVDIDGVHAGHAHQLGHSVDFSGTGAAFTCLAVPAYGEIIG